MEAHPGGIEGLEQLFWGVLEEVSLFKASATWSAPSGSGARCKMVRTRSASR